MDAEKLITEIVSAWAPPPPLTGSQWADMYRRVAVGPFPGQWQTDRTPYLKEPLDCITDPRIEEIVIMKPTRVGGTEVINNAIGYYIHYDPCHILYVQTSLDEGRKYSNEILMPNIDATPVLRERVARERGRKATQTKLLKSFFGGSLVIVGAMSAKGFRMVSNRVVICDDIDGYEGNKEGDIIELAKGRAKDYWNKKIILVSNPTTEGVSKILQAYESSDMRLRYTPCPHCDGFQVLRFGGKDENCGLKWDSPNGEVFYLCEHCHERIFEYSKREMDMRGEWRAQAPFKGVAGFKFNPFLCDWHPWAAFRDKFLASKADASKLYVFVTQWLGEAWRDRADRLDEEIVYNRRETYDAEVPDGVLILTAAVDVQDKRLEAEVKGWGPGEESWGIDYRVFNGSPVEEKVWAALDDYLLRMFRHVTGALMPIKSVAIDTGGHHTAAVYAFTKPREVRGVFAVKGSNNAQADVLDGNPTFGNSQKALLQKVGVTSCKDILAGRLRIERPGAGYMHFPMSYDREYFHQLVEGEKLIILRENKREWRQTPGVRNESIDLHNYNLAALRKYAPDWEQLRREGPGAVDITRRVYRHHNREKHQDSTIQLNTNLPIVVCADFGRNPLIWVLAQFENDEVRVFDELQLRNADTTQMAIEFVRRYGRHKAGFIVYGSAVGAVRASTGKSEYAILRDYGLGTQRYRPMNPLEIDRINAVNNMLENIAGKVRLKYHPQCVWLRRDFEFASWLEDRSDIDRTDFGRGHAVEALSHYIAYEFPMRSVAHSNRRFYK